LDDHRAIPVLPCRDLAAAIAFYSALGFTLAEEFEGGYAILEVGPHELHLAACDPFDPAQSLVAVYLRVADVEAWHARALGLGLPASGIPRLHPLENKPWGLREFALIDPDGTLIRIGTVMEE
jgi:catechol 2,3-dioxygenase-like lactoylglutathione lyase family enzyme